MAFLLLETGRFGLGRARGFFKGIRLFVLQVIGGRGNYAQRLTDEAKKRRANRP